MLPKATTLRNVLLLAFVVCALLNAQSVALGSEEFHQHPSTHCCGLCHTGPLPLIAASVTVAFAPTLSMTWIEWSRGSGVCLQVLSTAGDSRAPPA